MATIIKDSGTGQVKFETKDHWYIIEYIDEYPEEQLPGWNVRSSSGINHYENGLLHPSFNRAYLAMKMSVRHEDMKVN